MQHFRIINRNTGFQRSVIKAENYDIAEQRCLEKGIDMYDEYMLVPYDSYVHPAHSLINEIINR